MEKKDFLQIEQLFQREVGAAGIPESHIAKFLQVRLRDNALHFLPILPLKNRDNDPYRLAALEDHFYHLAFNQLKCSRTGVRATSL